MLTAHPPTSTPRGPPLSGPESLYGHASPTDSIYATPAARTPAVFASSARRHDAHHKGSQLDYQTPVRPYLPTAVTGSAYRSDGMGPKHQLWAAEEDDVVKTPQQISASGPSWNNAGLSLVQDGGLDESFVGEEFKRLVDDLDNEAFTQYSHNYPSPGHGEQQRNHLTSSKSVGDRDHSQSSIDEHLDFGVDINGGWSPNRDLDGRAPSERNSIYDSESVHGLRDHNSQDDDQLDAPSLQLLDTDLENLENGPVEHDFSGLEGLTDLDLTGVSHGTARYREDPPFNSSLGHQEASPYNRQTISSNEPGADSASQHILRTSRQSTVPPTHDYHENSSSGNIFRTRYESNAAMRHSITSQRDGDRYFRPVEGSFDHDLAKLDGYSDAEPGNRSSMRYHDEPYDLHADVAEHLTPRANSSVHPDAYTSANEDLHRRYSQGSHFSVGSQDAGSYHRLLLEARQQYELLRTLNDQLTHDNEKLAQENETLHNDIEIVIRDADQAATKAEAEYERMVSQIRQEETVKRRHLQEEIQSLQTQLQNARMAEDQMASIRSSLQKEKELDILSIKKELTAQKERELQELRREIHDIQLEKENTTNQLREELRLQRVTMTDEREHFEAEMQRLRKALMQRDETIRRRDDEIADFEARLHAQSRKPTVEDFSQQYQAERETCIALREQMESMQSDYERQLQTLRSELDSTRREQKNTAPDANASLPELLKRYPRQLEEWVSRIRATESNREHDQSADELRAHYEAEVGRLKSHIKEERFRLREKHRQDIQQVTTKLKEQCAQAYDLAIKRLKADYTAAEQRLNEEKERYARANSSRLSERPGGAVELRRVEELQRRVAELQNEVDSCKETIARAALEHHDALLQAKNRNSQDLHESLQKMKAKYLDTLKTMRDDLARSKKHSLEKMEAEWKKRKRELDESWQIKLEQLRQRYESGNDKPKGRSGSRPHPFNGLNNRAVWRPAGPA
ncbi:hypothetical protein BC832DRAFT_561856 [Gaertneriomyces semiglobifer]|nr:hypothetical protein BC832DRAFT_561856 [Gaertneriomyces semiglobifer]